MLAIWPVLLPLLFDEIKTMDLQWFQELAQQSPQILVILVGVVSFLESIAVIGLLIPGVVIISGFSLLAGQLHLPYLPLLISASLGAFIGDSLSFLFGYTLRFKVYSWKIFKRHPAWLEKSSQFFYKYGIYSILIARFVGPIRPFLPLTAGMFHMPFKSFFTINALAASLWAPIYLLPPYFVGKAIDINQHWIWLCILSGILIFAEAAARLCLRIKSAPGFYYLVACLVMFFLSYLWSSFAELRGLEDQLLRYLQAFRSAPMDKLMFVLTTLGNGNTLFVIPISWAIAECSKSKAHQESLTRIGLVLLYWSFVVLTNYALKLFFSVPRPEGFIVHPLPTFSFPSGHAQAITIATGWIFLISKNQLTAKPRLWLLRFFWLLILGVSFSRIYFGVHRPADIFGGWAIGGLMLYLWIYFSRFFCIKPSKTWGVYLILASLLTIVALHYPNWSFSIFQLSSSHVFN